MCHRKASLEKKRGKETERSGLKGKKVISSVVVDGGGVEEMERQKKVSERNGGRRSHAVVTGQGGDCGEISGWERKRE